MVDELLLTSALTSMKAKKEKRGLEKRSRSVEAMGWESFPTTTRGGRVLEKIGDLKGKRSQGTERKRGV